MLRIRSAQQQALRDTLRRRTAQELAVLLRQRHPESLRRFAPALVETWVLGQLEAALRYGFATKGQALRYLSAVLSLGRPPEHAPEHPWARAAVLHPWLTAEQKLAFLEACLRDLGLEAR